MKPIRLEARVRNNILWHQIFDRYPSVRAFCKDRGHHEAQIGQLLNLRITPLSKHGGYRPVALVLAHEFRMLVEDLFPKGLYGIKETRGVAEISFSQLTANETKLLIYEQQDRQRSEKREAIEEILATLAPREAEIVRRRFGFVGEEESLETIARHFDVTKERIRQIETKALRRLRHPRRRITLAEFVDEIEAKKVKKEIEALDRNREDMIKQAE